MGSEVNARIAGRLRARRKALGLSAMGLQMQSGVSRAVIANFENGRTGLSVADYFALITVLGVEPDLFMRVDVCERCGGLPPDGYRCADCGAGEALACMACHDTPPAGFICRACGVEGVAPGTED